ncbi:amidase signature enzyme [Fusarium circinatum]|uniref:Amidase signature enzyme n=1 Tax=Fusarium circinatum TaxID=48490 RepID=A0A8H5UAX8_FUSCI|nr:amidase signature enzyme [Fusarium circinatum]
MHFPSIAAMIALAATAADAAKVNLEIGYFSTIVPPIGGNIPGVGCGPWALATGADGSTKTPTGMKGGDECPNSELKNYCQRFGCPQTLRIGDTLAFQIQSGSGQSLKVKASVLNGKSQTVTCGRSVVTHSGNSLKEDGQR